MKIAIITVKLLPEADDIPNDDMEKAILEGLEDYPRIPYMERVEKVKVQTLTVGEGGEEPMESCSRACMHALSATIKSAGKSCSLFETDARAKP